MFVKRMLWAVAVMALLTGTTAAHALLLDSVGDPMSGHSWGQCWRFGVETHERVSEVGFYWYGPDTEGFKTDRPVREISESSWSGYSGSSRLAWMKGSDFGGGDLQCELWCTPDDISRPLCYDIVFWDRDRLMDKYTCDWDGHNWHISGSGHDYGGCPSGSAPVPEPASCALLACAMGGIGVVLKKRRRK